MPHNRQLENLPGVLVQAGKWGLTAEQLAEQIAKIKVSFEWGETPQAHVAPPISSPPKKSPKPKPRYPDLSHLYDWVCAHHESPLWPVLRDSGYLGDQEFIDRTVRSYDGWQWRWFFSVQRGIKRDVWRAEWAKFVDAQWRELGDKSAANWRKLREKSADNLKRGKQHKGERRNDTN